MVNKILRVVIGIIIAVGLLFGIYMILPAKYGKNSGIYKELVGRRYQ